MNKILNKMRSAEPRLRAFFEGRIYPLVIAMLVAVGHITGTELYLNIPLLVLVWLSLLICRSTLPLITPLVCFIYQVPLVHSPGFPTHSDYYLKTGRLVVIIILAVLTLAAIIYRFTVNIRAGFSKRTPMLIPLAALSAAMMLNGAFSSEWTPENLVFGFVQIISLGFIFYLFLFGLQGVDKEREVDYFCYATLCISLVLIAEVANMFITYDGIIAGGEIVKDKVNLGWGIWNPVGFSLVSLIPVLVLGAMRGRYTAAYLAAAVLTWCASVLTMSRNALIFGTLALVASVILGCFAGKKKKLFRIATIVGIFCALVGIILLREKLAELFSRLLEQGLSDNGRFELWGIGIENFLSAPIFGTGFFGYGETDVFDAISFIPTMAHNTVVQLLSATGVIGLLAYVYYRFCSLKPLIERPSVERIMLLSPLFILMGMSLLDNFVFYAYTVFYSTVALAIVHSTDSDR